MGRLKLEMRLFDKAIRSPSALKFECTLIGSEYEVAVFIVKTDYFEVSGTHYIELISYPDKEHSSFEGLALFHTFVSLI